MEKTEIKKIVEALLFVSDRPLSTGDIKGVLEIGDSGLIRDAIKDLAGEYEAAQKSLRISEIAGGYQMETDESCAPWLKKLFAKKKVRLSGPSLETLAVIAYKQPVTKAEIEVIRGVSADGVIKSLLDRDLIKVSGRKDVPGRPLLYVTTKLFLEKFGLSSIRELPHPKDFKESDIMADDKNRVIVQNLTPADKNTQGENSDSSLSEELVESEFSKEDSAGNDEIIQDNNVS